MAVTDELFVRIYEKNKNSVYSVIYNYIRNTADASDLTQEVFVKLYAYNKEFESDEHIKAWLIRVAVNLSKNHIRDSRWSSYEELDENLPDREKEDHSDVMSAVLALPEKYRIPIHLFYYEGWSVKQIADVLGLREPTVKTRLDRGRQKIKNRLEKEAGHYEYRFI